MSTDESYSLLIWNFYEFWCLLDLDLDKMPCLYSIDWWLNRNLTIPLKKRKKELRYNKLIVVTRHGWYLFGLEEFSLHPPWQGSTLEDYLPIFIFFTWIDWTFINCLHSVLSMYSILQPICGLVCIYFPLKAIENMFLIMSNGHKNWLVRKYWS